MVIYLQVESTLWSNIHASFIIEVIIELVEACGMKTGIYVNHWMDKLPAHRQTWELNNNDRHLASKSVALGSKHVCRQQQRGVNQTSTLFEIWALKLRNTWGANPRNVDWRKHDEYNIYIYISYIIYIVLVYIYIYYILHIIIYYYIYIMYYICTI